MVAQLRPMSTVREEMAWLLLTCYRNDSSTSTMSSTSTQTGSSPEKRHVRKSSIDKILAQLDKCGGNRSEEEDRTLKEAFDSIMLGGKT